MTSEAATAQPGLEPAGPGLNNRLNQLRAAVLGANDGIVSVAGIVMGVAGATDDRGSLVVGGVAGLVAGALSMAAGEYVSVSTQRDAELALVEQERRELAEMPEQEYEQLALMLERKGLTPELAHEVAGELTEGDPLTAHVELEYGIDPDDITNPWAAALSSMGAFVLGALLPLLTILLPEGYRLGVTAAAVACALAVTGWTSARLGFADPRRAALRNVCGGVFAMAVTFLVGTALGSAV